MKGNYARFMSRQAARNVQQTMGVYADTLSWLTETTQSGSTLRQGEEQLNVRLKPNQVYGIKCPDNPSYYRTLMLKENSFSGAFQVLITNPVMGEIPDGIQEVAHEQVFKQMREMNANLISAQSLQAFPFRGHMGNAQAAPGGGLVSDLHRGLQRGDRS